MTRYSFGEAISDDDILEIQGVEYQMQPVGMRAMRKLLDSRNQANGDRSEREQLDAAIDLILNAVRPDERERLREHIEESVPPNIVAEIVATLAGGMADLDPTLLASLSAGSPPTGPSSTAGAEPGASIPGTSQSVVPSTSTSTP